MTLSMLVLSLVVKSSAFAPGQPIPKQFSCEGKDEAPQIEVADLPAYAQSWALVVDDPDAPSGTFTHWVVWNLSPKFRTVQVSSDQQRQPQLLGGAKQGKNDFGKWGWSGPCPPAGKPHHYRFRVWALDGVLTLPAGAGASDLERAVKGHVVAEGQLVGTFAR